MLVPQSNSSEEPVKDHCNLEVLNAATLVVNTKQRFTRDWIYTYISEILIAVNPFKYIDGLYTDEKKAMYKGVNWTTLEPHVYAAAEMAFKHMELQSQSQSLLVSGESGAGKTETNKQLMDYLIWRAGIDKAKAKNSDLAQQILDTNPVLEAFGNAKNSRNKNSSRFGKYVNLKFNRDLQVMGAEIRTFLLEKSRVTSTSLVGERSYHIFYQIISGSQDGSAIAPPSAHTRCPPTGPTCAQPCGTTCVVWQASCGCPACPPLLAKRHSLLSHPASLFLCQSAWQFRFEGQDFQ